MKKIYCYFFCAIMIGLFSCGSKEGFQIDPNLKELGELNTLALQYDDVSDKVGDYLVVKSHNKWGVINLKGDTIIGFDYDEITDYPEGYWSIKNRRPVSGNYFNVGLAKMDGTILFPPVDDGYRCGPIAEGLYFTEKSDGYVFFDGNGKEVFLEDEEGYDICPKEVHEFGNNCFMALLADEKWYRIFFAKGDEANCKLDTVGYTDVKTCNNLCYVKNEEEKWGAIDPDGKLVVPYTYSNAIKKGNGVNCVFVQNEEGKWGFVKSGELIGSYDSFLHSYDNYAFVKDGKYKVVLDVNGEELFRVEDLDELKKFNGVFMGLRHIYDTNGKTLMTVDDSLRINNYLNGYVVVSDKGQQYWSILDDKGKAVIPFDDMIFEIGKESIESIKLFEEGDSIITNLFNTRTGEYIEIPYTIRSFVGDYYLAEIKNRCIFIDEQGRTGIQDFEDMLIKLKEEAQQPQQEESIDFEETIKKQLVEMINEELGREVLSSTSDIWNFREESNGIYIANYSTEDAMYKRNFVIRNIKIDKDGKVLEFETKQVSLTPQPNLKKVENVPTVEEQELYYKKKLMEGNRYNPFK